jgi:hypothetical protein
MESPVIKVQLAIGSKVRIANLAVTVILVFIMVAGFATLRTSSKAASCKRVAIDDNCWIERCQNYTKIQCNRALLNLTVDEFKEFLAVACWSHTENTSCSITREIDNKELYHLEYSPAECGVVCHAF